MSSVIDHLNSTASLIDFAVDKLEESDDWHTYFLCGASVKSLLEQFPDMSLPAAVVWLGEAEFGNKPRREQTLVVLVCCDRTVSTVAQTLANLCDQVIRRLDDTASGDARFKVKSILNLDLDDFLSIRQITFVISDN